ncbi:MAG TPA: hypothetical protein VEA99_03265 [Gemmatimonadaceae bacterium]|nr:hypothetical protein [Gemmatimonadaceae bacterium]
MRSSVLLHSALAGAVMAGVVGLLLVGAATVVAVVAPFPPSVARLVDRRGVALAVTTIAFFLLAGAVLGYLEGRLKLR